MVRRREDPPSPLSDRYIAINKGQSPPITFWTWQYEFGWWRKGGSGEIDDCEKEAKCDDILLLLSPFSSRRAA